MKNKTKVMKNMLFGIIGAAICMGAAWLSLAYGKGNVRNGFIQSNWPKMPFLRFEISIVLYAIGVPLYYLGAKDMVKAIRMCRRRRYISDFRMAKFFDMSVHLAAIGGLFVNASYAMMAIVYKLLYTTSLMGADIISTTEGMFYYVAIPVFAYYIIAIVGTSIPYIHFVLNGRLKVSKICVFFNPLVMFAIGEGMKLTKIYHLVDFSSAMVPFGFLLMLAAGMCHVAKMPVERRRERV